MRPGEAAEDCHMVPTQSGRVRQTDICDSVSGDTLTLTGSLIRCTAPLLPLLPALEVAASVAEAAVSPAAVEVATVAEVVISPVEAEATVAEAEAAAALEEDCLAAAEAAARSAATLLLAEDCLVAAKAAARSAAALPELQAEESSEVAEGAAPVAVEEGGAVGRAC